MRELEIVNIVMDLENVSFVMEGAKSDAGHAMVGGIQDKGRTIDWILMFFQ